MMGFGVRVLCSPVVATGFGLAGLASVEAADPTDGARKLLRSLDEPGLGVLLVEDAVYAALSEADRRTLARRPLPMVVPFPGPEWAVQREGPEAFIAELLRRAIGYRVKLS
jgi:vacuolar-type H+-ATPase subunit F/Vma7